MSLFATAMVLAMKMALAHTNPTVTPKRPTESLTYREACRGGLLFCVLGSRAVVQSEEWPRDSIITTGN